MDTGEEILTPTGEKIFGRLSTAPTVSTQDGDHALRSQLSDFFRPGRQRQLDRRGKRFLFHRTQSRRSQEPAFDNAIGHDLMLFDNSRRSKVFGVGFGGPSVEPGGVHDLSSSSFNFTLGLRESDNRHARLRGIFRARNRTI